MIEEIDTGDKGGRTARHGIYPKSIELDLSADRLQRFFSRTDSQYQISRNIRDMVIFATHNLGKDPPFSRLDLISCRNVLIYMQPQLQKKVLRISHYALNPDGFLILGTSEGVGDAVDLFSLVDRKLKIFSKKNAPPTAVFDMIFGQVQNLTEPERRAAAPRRNRTGARRPRRARCGCVPARAGPRGHSAGTSRQRTTNDSTRMPAPMSTTSRRW